MTDEIKIETEEDFLKYFGKPEPFTDEQKHLIYRNECYGPNLYYVRTNETIN